MDDLIRVVDASGVETFINPAALLMAQFVERGGVPLARLTLAAPPASDLPHALEVYGDEAVALRRTLLRRALAAGEA